MQDQLPHIIEKLRASGFCPRFVAPVGEDPPPELRSSKKSVTRQVGRHKVTANDKGGRGV